LIVVVNALWSGLALMRPLPAFTPYVPKSLPQGATGDFDGDGRPDEAHIQDRDEGRAYIGVRLSGSSAAVSLDGPFAAVIDGDIDHDGDLDLVAATASGDVLIWLNDGHGRFTPQERSPRRGVTSEPGVVNGERNQPVAVGLTAPFITSGTRAETAVVVAQIRPPTAPLAFDLNFLLLQSLRAPPTFSVQRSPTS
jgi:hypothetical protein